MGKKRSTHIGVERELITSRAFIGLTGEAVKLLFHFMLRIQKEKTGKKGYEKWVTVNNGEIFFKYDDARKIFGWAKSTFKRNRDALIKNGFLDIAKDGGPLTGPTLYSLSERWRDYGTDQFKEIIRPKSANLFGFTSKNWEKRTGRNRCKSQRGVKFDTSFDIQNDTDDDRTCDCTVSFAAP